MDDGGAVDAPGIRTIGGAIIAARGSSGGAAGAYTREGGAIRAANGSYAPTPHQYILHIRYTAMTNRVEQGKAGKCCDVSSVIMQLF